MIGRGGGGGKRVFDPALRIGVVAFVLLVGFALLFIRLGYIQLGQFGGRLNDVNKRVWSNMYIQTQRGQMLDREGRVFAASVEGKSIYAHPAKVKDINRAALLLARHGLLSIEESLERLSSPHPFVWLCRGLEPDRWKQLKEEFSKVEGVAAMTEWRRRYPLGAVGANVIGFVGADGHGLAGVEYMSDRELAGDIGSLHIEIGEHGLPIIRDAEGRQNPVFHGGDVQLTLDAYLQEASDQALSAAVENHEAKAGSVVTVNARTGEVLAVSSYPTFDPNRFTEYPSEQYRNMALNAIFEPGSTFKIVTIASVATDFPSAMESSTVCKGSIHIPGAPKVIRCYANHGPVSFRQSVEASCNVGIIRAAQPLPKETFFRMIQNFGFGIATGVGLPGEEKGILKKPFQWSLTSQASMSIGHEIATTNMQIAMAMTAIANGGELLKPQMIREAKPSPKVVRRVIRSDVAARVRNLLTSAVEGEMGTGKKAKIPGVRSGGKTGTALVPDPKTGGYDPNRFVSSFVGFFPVENPKYVISVVIHEPNPAIAHFGGDVAAPVFSKVGDAAMKFISPN